MILRNSRAQLLVVVALFCSVLALAQPIGAQEPPSVDTTDVPEGFTDGWPVGADDPENGATRVAEPTGDADGYDPADRGFRASSVPTPDTRYFGKGAYGAIVNASNSISNDCGVSSYGKVALMLAPIFKESSNATSPSTAPSPMTLSRYDEWSGTRNGTSNGNANYGLYAFENPNTGYARAYWHPGIGIWQYDSAGVGAPFTASERMDTGIVGRDVARVVITRYCNAKANGDLDIDARYEAWRDWGYPCGACEQAFRDLSDHRTPGKPPSGSRSGFTTLELVSGISRLGGTQRRNCSINGGGTIPCWYVDPGRAQGADWWAHVAPNDGKPRQAPAPLSHPFYVYKSGGREYRHWMRADTGYGIDISASRKLGQNARPRSGRPASGLTWKNNSGLCDKTTDRGNCGLFPPMRMDVRFSTVNGSHYEPIAGDFDGDGLSDVFWYAPGAAQDYIWWSNPNGTFRSSEVRVGGAYEPLVGDVDGNGVDDIVWYGNGSASYLWRGRTSGNFRSTPVNLPGNRQVFLASTRRGGAKDIVAYGPGGASDRIYYWSGGFRSRSIVVNGNYKPFVGDFDNDGVDDIFWYAPGTAGDYLWWASAPGGQMAVTVNGSYAPIVGDFDGNGSDDIMWYGVGSTPDYTWFGRSNRNFVSLPTSVGGAYDPVVADLGDDGRDDIVWYAPGSGTDYWWRYGPSRRMVSSLLTIRGTHVPLAGTFGSGRDGIFWYGRGSQTDLLWYL